jgi:hypothetical protein
MANGQRPSADGPHRKNVVRIVPVPAIGVIAVRFLGELQGLLTHYKGKGTVPCPGEGKCNPADHRLRTIFKAYAAMQSWDSQEKMWFSGVLEATEALEEQLRDRKLRGEVWILSRDEGKGNRGTVFGVFSESIDPDRLPPAFDVRPVLERVFHRTDFVLGVKNPMPRQLILPGTHDDQPKLPLPVEAIEEPKPTKEQMQRLREVIGRRSSTVPQPSSNGKDS